MNADLYYQKNKHYFTINLLYEIITCRMPVKTDSIYAVHILGILGFYETIMVIETR